MAPQRRKFPGTGTNDDNRSNKKPRNSFFTSFYTRRSSKSNNVDTSDSVFSLKKCLAFFAEYSGSKDAEYIGPEGIQRLCKDLEVVPEDIVTLVLAWKMEAKQMGYFTQKEWIKGLTDLNCDNLPKLRNKLDYLRTLLDDSNHFRSIYRYAFDFTKDKDQRSIEIDTAKLMLSLLLADRWPMFGAFHRFLEESNYKVINKDQWCNILEFSRIINVELTNYDEDGAWPVMLDEFVEWYHQKKRTINSNMS